jgi:hypothetical protein
VFGHLGTTVLGEMIDLVGRRLLLRYAMCNILDL